MRNPNSPNRAKNMTDEIEDLDSTNQENENDNSTNINDTSDDNTEDVEALKEQNKKLFARAKKAEGFVLENGQWIKKPQPKVETKTETKEVAKESYSLSDIRALNDVPDEDVADVVEYAKFKGITIAEAKKTSVIKTLLAENAENRKVAEATNVKTTKRTMQKPNGSDVIADAEKGNFPTDPAELARARTEKLQAKR